MGWSTISKPGTEYGPCESLCEHKDCRASREAAQSLCVCGQAIGYETKYYSAGDGFVHAACAWEAEERRARVVKARHYMKHHVQDYVDASCGEVNCTALVEDAAHYADADQWLDDESHPVWDWALEFAEAYRANK